MARYGSIYGLYDPRNDALRYVGQTTRILKKRLQEHTHAHSRARATHLAHWVSTLWAQGLRPYIKELASADSREALDALEVATIASCRSAGVPLTNHTDGGGGQIGREVSEATRRKLSLANKGRPAPHMQHPRSEETKRKIQLTLKGRDVGVDSSRFRKDVTLDCILRELSKGCSQGDAAKALSVSYNTVASRLRQARGQGITIPRNYKAWNKGKAHSQEHLAAWYSSRWGGPNG